MGGMLCNWRREKGDASSLVTYLSQNAFRFSFVFSALCQPKCITQTYTLPASPGQLKQLGAKSHSIVVPSLGQLEAQALTLTVICLLMSVSRSWTHLTCCDSQKRVAGLRTNYCSSGETNPRTTSSPTQQSSSRFHLAYKLWQYLNCATPFESSHRYIVSNVQSNVNAPKKQARMSTRSIYLQLF